MTHTKQYGFAPALLVAIIVAVLAVGGFVAWRMYGPSQKPAQVNQTTNNQTSQQTDPNQGYVVIKEWGVRFKPVDGLSGVQYFKVAGSSDDAISFTTDAFAAVEPTCGSSSGKVVLGVLQRTQTISQFGKLHGPFNGYYYYSMGPQAACGSAANEQLEGQTLTRVMLSLDSLEAAK